MVIIHTDCPYSSVPPPRDMLPLQHFLQMAWQRRASREGHGEYLLFPLALGSIEYERKTAIMERKTFHLGCPVSIQSQAFFPECVC